MDGIIYIGCLTSNRQQQIKRNYNNCIPRNAIHTPLQPSQNSAEVGILITCR
jgi:hypothetical protein